MTDEEMDYSEWSSCEMYGHKYYDSETLGFQVCQDCGDGYYDDSQSVGEVE